MNNPPVLCEDVLPSATGDVDFRDSAYFTRKPDLPSIADVRAAAACQHSAGKNERWCPPPVLFPESGLIVKYGLGVTLIEGQYLRAIRRLFGDQVPVPEVYGWKQEKDEVFIYMELVQGVTLRECWDTFSDDDKITICQELGRMISLLRTLKYGDCEPFIGTIGRQPLQDFMFAGMRACDPKPGPFTCSDDFHQYLIDVARLPARLTPTFPRNMPIVFTHADLHKSNILVYPSTGQGAPPRVAAILDWHSAGWFPAYWELCKMMWTADPAEDDEIELIMESTGGWQYRDLYDGWCTLARRIH